MIRKDQNRRRMAAVMMTVLFWTFGYLAGPGMVFCVAGPDHAAIEPAHYGAHTSLGSTGDHESAAGWNLLRIGDTAPIHCIDMPISGFVLSRPHPEHPPLVKLSILTVQPSGVHNVWAWMKDHATRDPSPAMPTSFDSHLKSIVLLI